MLAAERARRGRGWKEGEAVERLTMMMRVRVRVSGNLHDAIGHTRMQSAGVGAIFEKLIIYVCAHQHTRMQSVHFGAIRRMQPAGIGACIGAMVPTHMCALVPSDLCRGRKLQ
jgi:hypothetical protein